MKNPATLVNSLMLVLLLGATGSLRDALATLLMFATVLGAYSVSVLPLRSRLTPQSLLLASVVLAATLSSCFGILLQRWSLPWQQSVELYIGLIALQCAVLEHNGFFRQPLSARLKRCAQFAGLLVALALLRESIGHGSIGRHLSEHWQGLVLFSAGLPLATMTAGGFILLGLLLAAYQAWTRPTAPSKESPHP